MQETTGPLPSLLISKEQLAAELDVCERTIANWERQGVLPKRRRIGGRLGRFIRSEVEEKLKELPVATADNSAPIPEAKV